MYFQFLNEETKGYSWIVVSRLKTRRYLLKYVQEILLLQIMKGAQNKAPLNIYSVGQEMNEVIMFTALMR